MTNESASVTATAGNHKYLQGWHHTEFSSVKQLCMQLGTRSSIHNIILVQQQWVANRWSINKCVQIILKRTKHANTTVCKVCSKWVPSTNNVYCSCDWIHQKVKLYHIKFQCGTIYCPESSLDGLLILSLLVGLSERSFTSGECLPWGWIGSLVS